MADEERAAAADKEYEETIKDLDALADLIEQEEVARVKDEEEKARLLQIRLGLRRRLVEEERLEKERESDRAYIADLEALEAMFDERAA